MTDEPERGASAANADAEAQRLVITRRDFLATAGVALASSILPAALTGCTPGGVAGGSGELPGPSPNFTVSLIRPADLLSLKIGFVNLSLSRDGSTLEPVSSSDPAYLQVDFGPQHVLEARFRTGVDHTGVDAAPADGSTIKTLIAGNTRVVFVVPAGQSLEYSVPSLLRAFGTLAMNVPQLATPTAGLPQPMGVRVPPVGKVRIESYGGTAARPGGELRVANAPPGTFVEPGPPTSIETALELPTRLLLAPNQYAGWAHSLSEVTSASQRTELWHTRLGVRVGDTVDESDAHADARTVRAFWARDNGFNPAATFPPPATPPKMPVATPPKVPGDTDWAAMVGADRAQIVFESSSGYRGTPTKPRAPQAIRANRLMLSALGGWLDVHGDFGEGAFSGLEEWQQRTTMGRDHYIKLVHAGILYPFCHRAVLAVIAERKLNGGSAEALWQTAYVIVRQPTVSYATTNPAFQAKLRQFPFTQITITTLSTPELIAPPDPPGVDPIPPRLADGSNEYYAFKMVGIDYSGREVHFESPALWVPAPGGVISTTADLEADFQDTTPTSLLKGQRVTFAPEAPLAMDMAPATRPGGTTYETQSLTYGSPSQNHQAILGPDWPDVGAGKFPFLPQLSAASVAIEALRALGSVDGFVDVAYHPQYLANGFGTDTKKPDNAGDLLFVLHDAGVQKADFSSHSDQSGGFVNPNMVVTALSRALGPVAGADQSAIAGGGFDPTVFFAALSGAKIFGVFKLTDILPSGLIDSAPKFLTHALNDVEALVSDAQQLISLAASIKSISEGMPLQQWLSELDAAASMQVQSQLTVLQGTLNGVNGIVDTVTTLVKAVGDVVTTPANISTDTTSAVDALGKLPMLLGQVPVALDGFASRLPPQLSNAAALLRTLADTFNQSVGGLQTNFNLLLTAYAAGQDLVKNLAVKLDWQTSLQGFPSGTAPIFDPTGGLILSGELRLKATQGKPAGMDLLCGLEQFAIHLFGGDSTFISIHFLRLQFVLKAGKKANVDVVFDKPGIVFEGPLSFVQTLTSIIPLDGFSDPPGISVSASGIVASFSIGLPTLAVGVFSLSNMSIGAGFTIPFIGDPVSVSFDFCTRDNPFVLTVSFLGGGGFFGIQLNPQGIELLEASFEAGAAIAVDFGVASGSVSAMIGIYFKMEFDATTSASTATLTGFFRFRGEVDVLGIITASIELYLELSYETTSQKVTGTATLDIDVSVFFFHATVSVTATKRFAGGNNDPTFNQIMCKATADDAAAAVPVKLIGDGYDPWQEYLNAFAA